MSSFSYSELLSPHVQACVRCYTSNWKVVRYNYRYLSSSVGCKTIQAKLQTTSVKQEFEVDFQGAPSETNSELGEKQRLYICEIQNFFVV